MHNQRNWAGNYQYSTDRLHEPENLEQVRQLITRYNKLKVLGTRHSFNGIADSTENLISLRHLDQVVRLDRERQTVTVEGGIKYGDLCRYLHRNGYALHNLASLPHISVAGACATATHGSGDRNGNLATAVHEMEIVTADGEVVVFSREQHEDHFDGVVVGLGGLGVVTKVTLKIIPQFHMRQDVYVNLPLVQLKEHFDDIFSCAYSVSLFTDWRNSTFNQVWLKQCLTDEDAYKLEPEFFGALRSSTDQHPVQGLETVNCTEQMGIAGPWYERLPHFRMDFTPSNGAELQSEYIIPREHGYDALCAIHQRSEHFTPFLLVSEVRTIAADNLWMSSSYKQDSVAVHFTWKDDWKSVRQILPMIEEQLAPFNARPHWGKLFTLPPSLLPLRYEKLPDFQKLLSHYDPEGKFRNTYLNTYIFGED